MMAKRNNKRIRSSQLVNFAKDSYLERTSRPIYAVLFLLPFVIFYEIGTILVNTDTLNQSQIRVVTFVWLQDLFRYFGFDEQVVWVLPPLVVVLVLLGLQIASKKPWSVNLSDLGPMAGECIVLAVPLVVLSLLLNTHVAHPDQQPATCQATIAYVSLSSDQPPTHVYLRVVGQELLANMVTGIGAGIYEELVFRLIVICLLIMLFQDLLGIPHRSALILSVLISAGLFSAHHHILVIGGRIGIGLPFSWPEFGFRTLAGVYFAVLFAIRGFGITAGTHAFYDIIATVLNWAFFVRR